jgi:ABC-type transporter MlaC component
VNIITVFRHVLTQSYHLCIRAYAGQAGGAVIAHDVVNDVATNVLHKKVKAERERAWLEKQRARTANKSAAFAAAKYAAHISVSTYIRH